MIAIIRRCEAYTLYADDRPITSYVEGYNSEMDYYGNLGCDG